jgi:signal peptidase II
MKVLTLLLASGFFLLFDQFTKRVVARLTEGQPAWAASWIRLRHVPNVRRGLILRHPRARLLVWAVLFSVITLIVSEGHFFQHVAAQLGLGMALGGAGSNVWDQLRRGAAVDFLDLGWWPVFNLADVAICIGAATAISFLR